MDPWTDPSVRARVPREDSARSPRPEQRSPQGIHPSPASRRAGKDRPQIKGTRRCLGVGRLGSLSRPRSLAAQGVSSLCRARTHTDTDPRAYTHWAYLCKPNPNDTNLFTRE